MADLQSAAVRRPQVRQALPLSAQRVFRKASVVLEVVVVRCLLELGRVTMHLIIPILVGRTF